MKREERLEIFRCNLSKLVEEGDEGSFVIFDVATGKFVQFVGSKEEGGWMICDIPLQELSKDEEKRLLAIEEFLHSEGIDAETGVKISYQAWFGKDDVEKAAEITERIFTEVFRLPDDYDVNVSLNLK